MRLNARCSAASAGASTSRPASSLSRARRSKVAASFERRRRLRPGQLVDGDPLPTGGAEGADWPVRNFEGRHPFPAALAQRAELLPQVRDAVYKDGRIALNVVREEEQRRRWRQLDGGNPGAHAFDGKTEPAAEHVDEIG